ncbi:MAG: FAD-binding oxidoreductase [Paracoccaceae bacterium]|nr:FAD-binding oxidoreductase [Paracoccaceae bacterium]
MLNPADEAFRAQLAERLPAAAFRQLTEAYLQEPRGRWRAEGGLLVAPSSTEEVAEVVRACAAARVGIVPYGGGTGLVGGQVMPEGPIPVILSLERMRRVRDTYVQENILVAEAGAILAEVQSAAEAAGRLFPLSLASEGSARIGGVLSTNAGGTGVLRYGNARDLCLGLEAVLPDGAIWHGLKRLRKDNAGYDLRNLLIGAEGTLGVITAAALRLFPIPAATGAAILAVASPAAALRLLAHANDRTGGGVSAFELMHRQGFDLLAETFPELRPPFAPMPEWSALIEVGLPVGLAPGTALEDIFAAGIESGLALDGVIAQSEAQRAAFWRLRETLPEANRRIGAVSSHDISVPLSAIAEFTARAPEKLAKIGAFRINCFGHVGDGNLHWNVFPVPGRTATDHAQDRDAIKRAVHDLVDELGGSVSAEHGIGRLKVDDLEHYGDPTKLAAMRAIKRALDPSGIMNPGAVLR